MPKIKRRITTILVCLLLLIPFNGSALAEGVVATVKEHKLSLILPEGAVILNEETAEDHKEWITSFGYTVASFTNYLKMNSILLFATEPESGLQISVKTWDSEFSKSTEDMAYLSDEAMRSVARELVRVKGASYKTVIVNGMQLLEIRSSGKDSGGSFCSVQYVTIRNGSFYSVNHAFAGPLNQEKVQQAWDSIVSLQIKDTVTAPAWDMASIFETILISALILLALFAIGVVLYSFVQDWRHRRSASADEVAYIERRNRFKRK